MGGITPAKGADHYWAQQRELNFLGRREHFFHGVLASLLRFSFSSQAPDISLGRTYEVSIRNAFRGDSELASLSEFADIRMIGTPALTAKNGVDLTKVLRPWPHHLRLEGSHVYIMELFGLIIFTKIGRGRWPAELAALPKLDAQPDYLTVRLIDFKNSLCGRDMLPFENNHKMQRFLNRDKKEKSSSEVVVSR